MTFVRKTWVDGDTGGTPITAAELNRMETGIAAAAEATALAPVATTGAYSDISGKPALAPVALSGSYADLTGTPIVQSLATVATTGSYNDLSNLPAIGTGTDTTASFGAVALDSFGGASDDAKLTNALAAVGADTYKRTIQLTNRQYNFTTANRIAFNGLRIAGPGGYANADKGAAYMPSEVHLTGTGPWFHNNAVDVWDVSLTGLAFRGGSTSSVLGQSGAGTWWRPHLRDISASGLQSVLGSFATPWSCTGAFLDGFWEINNSYNTAFHISGSDNRLFTSGGFLDSAVAFNTAGSANGQAHLWLDFCSNTTVGPLYITAEGPWTGVRITGTQANGGPIALTGLQIEGRNISTPSNGALVRMDGGIARFRDCNFHFAMSSPTTPARTPADAGVIHHADGQLVVSGASYDRATGVAETVPFVYTASTTGKCVVNGIQIGGNGPSWTGLPRVALKTGNTDNRVNDATVTQITV